MSTVRAQAPEQLMVCGQLLLFPAVWALSPATLKERAVANSQRDTPNTTSCDRVLHPRSEMRLGARAHLASTHREHVMT